MGFLDLARAVQTVNARQHFGIGKARHRALYAATEFLQEKDAVIAGKNRDVPREGLAQPGDLRGAGNVFFLDRLDLRMFLDQASYCGNGHPDAGGKREVLKHGGHVADAVEDRRVIVQDVFLGSQAGRRRDHDAVGAGAHDFRGQGGELGHAGIAYAGDDRLPAGPLDISANHADRLFHGKLGRLAGDPQHGQAGRAVPEIEIAEAVHAFQIHRPLFGERGLRNDEKASNILPHGLIAP